MFLVKFLNLGLNREDEMEVIEALNEHGADLSTLERSCASSLSQSST